MSRFDRQLRAGNQMDRHPHITRDRIVRTCPDCEGAGELIHNDTNPHGYGPDPQCDEPVECEACDGTGMVAEWTDPLVALHDYRPKFLRHRRSSFANLRYGTLCQQAVSPVLLPDMRVFPLAVAA